MLYNSGKISLRLKVTYVARLRFNYDPKLYTECTITAAHGYFDKMLNLPVHLISLHLEL